MKIMTREESNKLKTLLISKTKAGVYDRETYQLLRIFCNNSHTYKLDSVNRSLEAYPTEEAKLVKEELQKLITEKIEIWIKFK